MLQGFQIRLGEVSVSHLQFANDTLIMCTNSQRKNKHLRCILRCFEAVTGLKVNFGRSALIAIGDVPNIDMLAMDLGFKVGSLPTSHLGLPLGASFKKTNV